MKISFATSWASVLPLKTFSTNNILSASILRFLLFAPPSFICCSKSSSVCLYLAWSAGSFPELGPVYAYLRAYMDICNSSNDILRACVLSELLSVSRITSCFGLLTRTRARPRVVLELRPLVIASPDFNFSSSRETNCSRYSLERSRFATWLRLLIKKKVDK